MPEQSPLSITRPAQDYFALLNIPRHPWVDPAILKSRYHAAASQSHPDHQQGNQAHFILLGEAVTCLRETHSRLRHLVELEFSRDHKPKARPNAGTFQQVARALDSSKQAIQNFRKASSKLAKSTALASFPRVMKTLETSLRDVTAQILAQEFTCRQAGADWKLRGSEFWWAEVSRARFLAKWRRELEDSLFAIRNAAATTL